ncbi:MAG: hypothetical protein ACLQEQ_04650 [Nitrososphaerales archaeon]
MSGEIVAHDLANPIGSSLILNNHETIKGVYDYFEVVSNSSGVLIITSQRIVMSPGKGRMRFGQKTVIPLEQVSGIEEEDVLRGGKSLPALNIYANRKYILVLSPTDESPDSLSDIVQAVEELAQRWKARIHSRKVVNVNIDFADLREYIDRGGIIVKEVKCPSCGSPFEIPKMGTTTKCRFCGSTLVAEDVFAKLKQLLE